MKNRSRPKAFNTATNEANTLNRNTAEIVMNSHGSQVDHQYDSLCISAGEKDLQFPLTAANRSRLSSEANQPQQEQPQ